MTNPISDLVSNYLFFVNALCNFNYEVGREAAQCGLPKDLVIEIIISKGILEPQCLIAWEAGYDDQIAEWCNGQAS